MRLNLVVALGLFAAGPAPAATPLDPRLEARARQVLANVYSLDYAAAAAASRSIIEDYPDDPLGYMMLARTYWAEQLAAERGLSLERFGNSNVFADEPRYRIRVDPDAERRFQETSRTAIAKGKRRLQTNPRDSAARFLLGLAYQNQSSYEYSMRHAHWPALRAGELALRYHRELLKSLPDCADSRLSLGVSYYIADAVPWAFRWATFLLGYVASREKGKQELETVAAKGVLMADDARTVLALLYTLDRQLDRAFAALADLHRRYPQNYLVHLEMAGNALARRKPAEAFSLYQEVLAKVDAGRDRYERLERASVLVRLGVARRRNGDPAASADWFRKALADPKRSARTHTVAQLELAKTFDLLNRRDEALAFYRQVEAAEDVAGSRKEARDLLQRPYSEP